VNSTCAVRSCRPGSRNHGTDEDSGPAERCCVNVVSVPAECVTATRPAKPVIRGYVAIRELMSLVFALLLDGERGVVRFDTGGRAMEMQEIAEAVARVCGPVAVRRPPLEDLPTDRYAGSAGPYAALLRDRNVETVAFEQQITETAQFLSKNEEFGWMQRKHHASAGAAS